MQKARAMVTKAELDGLLAPPDFEAPAGRKAAEASPPDAVSSGDERRLIEQAFRHWEQTIRDLQREVKTLRERVEHLERMREAPQPVMPIMPDLPNPPAAVEPETPRMSRVERHRKSRWF